MPTSPTKSCPLELRKRVFQAYQLSRGVEVIFDDEADTKTSRVSLAGILNRAALQFLVPEIVDGHVNARTTEKSSELLREIYAGDPAAAHLIDRLLETLRKDRRRVGL